MTRRIAARLARPLVVLFTLSVAVLLLAAPAQAVTYHPISGAGSTWSANAIIQWAKNVNQFGMVVNYQSTGSSDGRRQFTNNTVDFGVSEIPYGITDNGVTEKPPARKYAYMPIVAGGTSFMYNLKIGNKQVDNLRLSGKTLAGIFTGTIKKWSDPAIKADNPGLALPARKIIPVVRSDGSGTTAQLTTWLSKKYPAQWNAYCAKAGRISNPCGVTSAFPIMSGVIAQNGSLGVAGYVSQRSSQGAITYVEYSYPLDLNFPVVKMLNSAGYYVLPTAPNVAVGLLKAKVNNDATSPNYLTQNLDGVYSNSDRRAYPLSSYSYMIIPTKVEGQFSEDKGVTLGAFAYYFLCEGQQQAPDLGYSPLPINLVKAGLAQVRKIPGVNVQAVDIKKCNNPTFSADGTNTLAKTALYPAACDKLGPTMCGTSTAGHISTGSGNGNGGKSGSGKGAAGGKTPTGTTATTNPDGTTANGAAGAVDPDTGQVIGGADGNSGDDVTALPVQLTSGYVSDGSRKALMGLAVMLLIGVAVGPPLISRTLIRRHGR